MSSDSELAADLARAEQLRSEVLLELVGIMKPRRWWAQKARQSARHMAILVRHIEKLDRDAQRYRRALETTLEITDGECALLDKRTVEYIRTALSVR